MKPLIVPTLLGAALALAVAGAASAQGAPKARTPAKADPALEAQLESAERNLDQAARRVAELQRQLGRDDDRVRVIEHRIERRPVIGVLLAPDAQAGVRIAGVTPDSGAAKAGLKTGDRIVSVDGTQVLGKDGDLRVANTRKLLGDLDAGKAVRIGYVRDGRAGNVNVVPRMDENVVMLRNGGTWTGAPGEPRVRRIEVPGMAPGVHEEIIRIGPRGDCKGKDCKMPVLAEAFRWNGLNLASVDPKLGRYFGTDRGVLVLSTGADLGELQPGDVIQKIDGRAVQSPRDAMDALRDKPENALALVEYLRDRRTASTRVKVPKALPFRMPAVPPVPPAPPAPPAARMKAPPAPPAPPSPPAAAAVFFRDANEV